MSPNVTPERDRKGGDELSDPAIAVGSCAEARSEESIARVVRSAGFGPEPLK